ncbi:MAG: O-antigen ligase family protein [Kouleothrix sp.]|nr:O-antigen ligase family protein [Kouleothrix sp.]
MTIFDIRRHLVTLSPCHLVTWSSLAVVVLVLALLPLQTLLLAIGAALALALPLLDPIFGLYWAILSVPVQELLQLPGGLSYTQAAMLLATLGWGLRVLAHPELPLIAGQPRGARLQLWLWAAFLSALLLAVTLSPYPRAAGLKEALRWIEAFLVWLMVVTLTRRRWQVAGLLVCLLLAPAAEATIGIAQFVSGAGPPSFRIAAGLPFVRAYGTIGQPNSFAGYLNMAWPLAVALAVGATAAFWRRDQRRIESERGGDNASPRRPLTLSPRHLIICALALWTTTALLLAALVASLSRGAWVGAAAGALGIALALGPRARAWALGALGVVALGAAIGGFGLLPGFVAARLASITSYLAFFDAGSAVVTPANFALVERMAQMQAGWHMFLAHPLTGVGPGSYTAAYPEFAVGSWYASRGHAHNYYIHMAAEAGAIGLLAYLALLAGLARQALVTLRRANGPLWRSAAIGCCGIISAAVAHDLFENVHVLSMGIQLAAVWGLLFVIERLAQNPLEHSTSTIDEWIGV